MNFQKINGWLRLYIAVVTLWVAFATYSLFLNMPSRPESSMLESRALIELTSEIEKIQNISSAEERHKFSSSICETAYLKGSLDKNECMEFMKNPKSGSVTSEAIMQVRIASPNVRDRALKMKQENDDRFNSALAELIPVYLRQVIAMPLILLFFGHMVAWIRRGFLLGK